MINIADIVGELHRDGNWNYDRRTRGCVAGPWEYKTERQQNNL